VRVERRPRSEIGLVVAEAAVSPPTGAFALRVPREALPSAAGERCALMYAVRARGVRGADVRVRASARPHLETATWASDRLLPAWEARHFHIELSDADLRGGGTVGGRVHRHAAWPAGAIAIRARCVECWRGSPWAERGTPQWHDAPLWEAVADLHPDPGAGWAPFRFELPDGLPPAVEARTIAWRYELLAERTVRHWFNETAALTPLLYEEATT
jgi:hypothetical protein